MCRTLRPRALRSAVWTDVGHSVLCASQLPENSNSSCDCGTTRTQGADCALCCGIIQGCPLLGISARHRSSMPLAANPKARIFGSAVVRVPSFHRAHRSRANKRLEGRADVARMPRQGGMVAAPSESLESQISNKTSDHLEPIQTRSSFQAALDACTP